MISFIRRVLGSKVGAWLGVAFVFLLGLLFLAGDLAGGISGLGGNSAGKVASAGDRKIETSTLDTFARISLDRARQQDPRQSMKSLVAAGGLNQILDELIDNAAVEAWGRKHGIVAGERLVGSELAKEPAFRGTTGNFDEQVYRAGIAQRGFTDKLYRELLRDRLVQEQALMPANFGTTAPREVVLRYASLLTESRQGSIAMIPSAVFAPKAAPGDNELKAFYAAHSSNYIRPERRVIRYALLDDKALKSIPVPTEAEIAAKYQTDAAKYAPSERRKLTQLVLPTEAAAKVVADEVAKGSSLEASATSKRLAVAAIAPITKADYATQNSDSAANAVFAGAQGKLVGPVKGSLGWYVVRADAVEKNAGKTLDQARPAIVEELGVIKKRAALVDFFARIEDEFDNGATLADVAKELGVTVQQTQSLTADGKVYGNPAAPVAPELVKVIQPAFAMEDGGQPQLAELVPGKTSIIFDAAQIQPSAPAPFAEIRQQVAMDYALANGAKAAKVAADKVLAAARKGTDLQSAMASLGVPLPPVDQVAKKRAELRQPGGVPPPLALMFSMAKGTVKLLEAANNRGWYVVALKDIQPGQIDPRDPALAAAAREFGQLAGDEYTQQLRQAMRDEVGSTKNEAAVAALAKTLTGSN